MNPQKKQMGEKKLPLAVILFILVFSLFLMKACAPDSEPTSNQEKDREKIQISAPAEIEKGHPQYFTYLPSQSSQNLYTNQLAPQGILEKSLAFKRGFSVFNPTETKQNCLEETRSRAANQSKDKEVGLLKSENSFHLISNKETASKLFRQEIELEVDSGPVSFDASHITQNVSYDGSDTLEFQFKKELLYGEEQVEEVRIKKEFWDPNEPVTYEKLANFVSTCGTHYVHSVHRAVVVRLDLRIQNLSKSERQQLSQKYGGEVKSGITHVQAKAIFDDVLGRTNLKNQIYVRLTNRGVPENALNEISLSELEKQTLRNPEDFNNLLQQLDRLFEKISKDPSSAKPEPIHFRTARYPGVPILETQENAKRFKKDYLTQYWFNYIAAKSLRERIQDLQGERIACQTNAENEARLNEGLSQLTQFSEGEARELMDQSAIQIQHCQTSVADHRSENSYLKRCPTDQKYQEVLSRFYQKLLSPSFKWPSDLVTPQSEWGLCEYCARQNSSSLEEEEKSTIRGILSSLGKKRDSLAACFDAEEVIGGGDFTRLNFRKSKSSSPIYSIRPIVHSKGAQYVEQLNLSGQPIKTLSGIHQMENLNHLDLSNSSFFDWEELSGLDSLKTLVLNQMDPSAFAKMNLESLLKLNTLEDLKLRIVSTDHAKDRALSEVDQSCRLSQFIERLTQSNNGEYPLPHLRSLDVRHATAKYAGRHSARSRCGRKQNITSEGLIREAVETLKHHRDNLNVQW